MTVLLALCEVRPTPWWAWLFLGPTCLLALWSAIGSVMLMGRDLKSPKAGRDG
jgi:hypothetical protein